MTPPQSPPTGAGPTSVVEALPAPWRPSRGLVTSLVALGALLFLLGWLAAASTQAGRSFGFTLGHDLAVVAFALVFAYLCLVAFRAVRSRDRMLAELLEKNRALEAAQQDRRQAMELAHVDRMNTLGKMVSSIGHELNQPLFAIVTLSAAVEQGLADSDFEDPELQADLRIISEQAERAGEVIRRLRHFGQMREIEREPTDLNEVVRETVRFLQPDARLHRVGLQTRLSSTPANTIGDAILLQQVLLNLAKNAIDSLTGQEEVEPRLSISTSVEAGERVRVAVEDNGKGVDVAADDLFKPFYSTKSDGLGMGLSISRSIVESHDGKLWASKNPDRGMTFSFDLPALAGAAREETG